MSNSTAMASDDRHKKRKRVDSLETAVKRLNLGPDKDAIDTNSFAQLRRDGLTAKESEITAQHDILLSPFVNTTGAAHDNYNAKAKAPANDNDNDSDLDVSEDDKIELERVLGLLGNDSDTHTGVETETSSEDDDSDDESKDAWNDIDSIFPDSDSDACFDDDDNDNNEDGNEPVVVSKREYRRLTRKAARSEARRSEIKSLEKRNADLMRMMKWYKDTLDMLPQDTEGVWGTSHDHEDLNLQGAVHSQKPSGRDLNLSYSDYSDGESHDTDEDHYREFLAELAENDREQSASAETA